MNPTEPTTHRITLYYRQGSSDKVYQAAIEPAGNRFIVIFAYGRRGSTLSTGTKTTTPVEYDEAKAIFDKLVTEKTANGYTPGIDGTPYQFTENASRATGILPMLLNPIDAAEAILLLVHDDWCLQEKLDGRRVLIEKYGDKIVGINRKGLAIGLPMPILVDIAAMPGSFILDGECVGDTFHAFDLLEHDGEDLRPLPLNLRMSELVPLVESPRRPAVKPVDTAYGRQYKSLRYDELKAGHKEGVVFKRLDAPYSPGRPNSGGPALKHKFTATLSAVVSAINAQRSVEIRLLAQDGWKVAGNVTIPANQPIPRAFDVIEVRYLYAFPESGVLFQPVYLGPRTDVDHVECSTDQLKFKPAEDDES